MDLNDVKEIFVIIGILVAIYGVDSWRREYRGRRSIELAEETLALFYEAKDAIVHIRHPASFAHEIESVERAQGETDEQWEARKNASIVFERYNKHRELFNRIHSMRYRFIAQVGIEEAKPFDELNNLVKDIFLAAPRLARLWPRDFFRTEEERKEHYEKIAKCEAIFWDSLSEDDPINPKLNKIISDIERICQSAILGKGMLHSLLNKLLFKKS